MIRPHRKHSLWLAFIVHRLSGVALALFLPIHFLVLGLALNDTASLNGFLQWSDGIGVKLAESGLVFLLAIHLFGGLRLLAMDWLPWTDRQKSIAAVATAGAFFVAIGFLLGVV